MKQQSYKHIKYILILLNNIFKINTLRRSYKILGTFIICMISNRSLKKYCFF